MNLRARREEESIPDEFAAEQGPANWIGWPAMVRRLGAIFCGLILFSFVLGLFGLSLRDGMTAVAVVATVGYVVVRMRRARRQGRGIGIQ